MKKIISCILFVVSFLCANAQISTNEKPVSFRQNLDTKEPVDTKILPVLDMANIEKEDQEDEKYDYPPRFGFSHKVNYDIENSGTWYKLPDGDKLWRLNIVCPNALSINLLYDKFWLPEGSKLFIYTKDKKHSIGAFTHRNNKGDDLNVQGFATGLLYGSEITLEYYQPHNVISKPIISIAYVIHGYRYIRIGEKSLGDAGECHYNINCPIGIDYQLEKSAIALILVNGNRICTGALINNTNNDEQPLFLTANHCLSDNDDAITSPNLNTWTFYWNYEAPGCDNIIEAPPFISTSGATLIANNSSSDFALLNLTEDPKYLVGYYPYYLGWDRSGNNGSNSACIHHPKGDLKKISIDLNSPITTNYFEDTYNSTGNHWRVVWDYGVTEKCSSGSPLLNEMHHVIGQLHGGRSACSSYWFENDEYGPYQPDWYGKFSMSWTGSGSQNPKRRLKDWLDPTGISPMSIDGKPTFKIVGPKLICDSAVYYVGGLTSNHTVTWTKQTTSFSCILLQNYPFANQCMIKRQNSLLPFIGTITASIYEGGNLIKQLTKNIFITYPFNAQFRQEACTYYGVTHPAISWSNITLGNANFVHMGCMVEVSSNSFLGMNISHGGASPSYFAYDGNSTVRFILPLSAGGAPFYITANSEDGCNDFSILFFSISSNGNLSNSSFSVVPTSEGYKIGCINKNNYDINNDKINTDKSEQEPWNLEVYNLQNGRIAFKTDVKDNIYYLNTSKWEQGNYIIRAILGDEVYTKKIRVE